MTSISPYLRGYRLALRDVQCATERYTKTLANDAAPARALFVAADRIGSEMFGIRNANRDVIRKLQEGEDEFRRYARYAKDPLLLLPRVVFGCAYRAGFDRALQLMTEHAWKMNDPAARFGILQLVMKFEAVRFEIAADEDGKIRTLRARNFDV